MRYLLALFPLFLSLAIAAQPKSVYSAADAHSARVAAKDLDSLTQKLIKPFKSDSEKVRSIFRWITRNIAYDIKHLQSKARSYSGLPDLSNVTDSVEYAEKYNTAVARMVLRRRMGVCDGYSRLFKAMCERAGINCVIVTGYGRVIIERIRGAQFQSNHAWNAVEISGTWRLLDATWASGYGANNHSIYVREFDEAYFLVPPERMAYDHYPNDPNWLLLHPQPDEGKFLIQPHRLPPLWNGPVKWYSRDTGFIAVDSSRRIHLALALKDSAYDVDIVPAANDHRISFQLTKASLAERSKPDPGADYDRNDDTMAKTLQRETVVPDKVHRPVSRKEKEAIESIFAFLDTASESSTDSALSMQIPVQKKAVTKSDNTARSYSNSGIATAPSPGYIKTGKRVDFDYKLPKGNFDRLEIWCNHELMLSYELVDMKR